MLLHLHTIRLSAVTGLKKGLHGFWWMIKILVPISFLTALMQWSGILEHLEFLIRPMMSWLSLPSVAALPLIIGMLTGIYGGIAAMVMLPLSQEQMTLIAIFLLACHNLIQETAVQANSGIHPLKATLFRLAAAILLVLIAAQFLDSNTPAGLPIGNSAVVSIGFQDMVGQWAATSFHLAVKIFFIVMGILTLLEIFKSLGWIEPLIDALGPLFMILGLSRRVAFLWITAVVFGLAYGAAVIVEETRKGDLTRDELETLHLSIGINHSMVEDPALFLVLGLNPFWLWIPRLVLAIVAVRLLRIWHRYRPVNANEGTG
jgi:hypothetical protein